jgi:hypothetical protein
MGCEFPQSLLEYARIEKVIGDEAMTKSTFSTQSW